jgi:hypothetical protein
MTKPGPSEVAAIKATVRERDGQRCVECGVPANVYRLLCGRELEVHRLRPGSPYAAEGCLTLCRDCHNSKPKSERGSAGTVALRVSKGTRDKLVQLTALLNLTSTTYDTVAHFLEDLVEAEHLKVRHILARDRSRREANGQRAANNARMAAESRARNRAAGN